MIAFGPVPSRRLGKSMGINNIAAPKVCSYNCIYCQVGTTKHLSASRQNFYSPQQIAEQVEIHLKKTSDQNAPDYLTFVSNGEPTLDKNIGQTIMLLRQFNIPIAVITNGSLLIDRSVGIDLQLADWVSVKIDAPDAATWKNINRAHYMLDFEQVQEGIKLFANQFEGTLCTETMLLRGINDNPETLQKLADIAASIGPHKAYLSIPVRPPAESSAKIPDETVLTSAWNIFTSKGLTTELLNAFEGSDTGYTGNAHNDILNITAVHPLRSDALTKLLQKNKAGFDVVAELLHVGMICEIAYQGHKFYLRKHE